jgi:hypothetical protein
MSCAVPPARHHLLPSGTFFLVVVNRFRKSNPDIEYPQSAADPAHKSVGNEGSQLRRAHQKMVVRPFGPPGKNYQKHPHNRADQAEHQHRKPMQPKFEALVATCLGVLRWYSHSRRRSIPTFRGRQLHPHRAWRNCLRCIPIRRHRVLRKIVSVEGRVVSMNIPSVRE